MKSTVNSKHVIWLVSVLLLSVFLWLKFSRIDELTTALGTVIAIERTQVIQPLYDGELKYVYVKEGDAIKKGDVLACLDNNRANAEYQDALAKTMALKVAVIRLKSEVFDTKLVFDDEFLKWSTYVNNQKALFTRRRTAVRETVKGQEQVLENIRSELSLTEPLVSSGDVGALEVLRLKRQELDAIGKISDVKNKYFQDAQAELTKTEEALTSQEQILSTRKDSLTHTMIIAPANGVVKNIKVHTEGAALKAGDTLMELVPTDGGLVVEAKLSPKDIAFIKTEMPASLKIDTYDYSIYGQAEGVVKYISPDVLSETDPKSVLPNYYRVLISVTKLPVRLIKGKKPILQPGMTTQVQIKTGDRTILNYLIKPIIKTFSESMTER